MQISIQSIEITYEKVPYKFIVKKVHTVSNEIRFHCWAPEDNSKTRELINNQVIQFEWDHRYEDLKYEFGNGDVAEQLKLAIRENFPFERA